MQKAAVRSILVSLLLGGCGRVADQPSNLSAADLDSIASLRRALVDAIVAGDAAAYADLCTEDVRLLHPGAPLISGRAELEDHNAAMFEAITVTSLKLSPVVGRMMAELVMEGHTADHDIGRFRLSRFEEGELLLPDHPYADRAHN